MMCIYSLLLILLNRSRLPAAIRITPLRILLLIWGTVLFGFLAVLTIRQQLQNL